MTDFYTYSDAVGEFKKRRIVSLTTCVCVTGNKSYYTKGTSALDVEN